MSAPPAAPPPDAANLYQAALLHLARYATTQAALRRVLNRRIDRWARRQPDSDTVEPAIAVARGAVDGVIKRLVELGAVNDTAFAESRARSLRRAGHSSRSVQARLLAKGVTAEAAGATSAVDAENELAAALVLVRKRRIGPYRATEASDAAVRMKEMALLARAGFSRQVAERALAMPRQDAENRILDLRR